MSLISQRVASARNGTNDKVICRMPSGWAVCSQPAPGLGERENVC